jgi:hypothetical protein
MSIELNIPLLEQLLAPWRTRIGADYDGYRNHVYRMLHICFDLHPAATEEERQKLIIAAAFHDIGIWSADTVDYLAPSIAQAMDWLQANGRADWKAEIASIIDLHHRIRPVTDSPWPLVELFRKGDLVDFSLGLVRFDVDRDLIRSLQQVFPNAGFHRRLLQLTWRQLRQNPLNPAPMMRW